MLNYFGEGVYSDSNDPIIKQHTFDGRDLPESILEAFVESDIKKVIQTLKLVLVFRKTWKYGILKNLINIMEKMI